MGWNPGTNLCQGRRDRKLWQYILCQVLFQKNVFEIGAALICLIWEVEWWVVPHHLMCELIMCLKDTWQRKGYTRQSPLAWVSDAPQIFLHFLLPHHEERDKTRKKFYLSAMLLCAKAPYPSKILIKHLTGCCLLHLSPLLGCEYTGSYIEALLILLLSLSFIKASGKPHTFSWIFTLSNYVYLLHSCFEG